jgi:hypothetical protein
LAIADSTHSHYSLDTNLWPAQMTTAPSHLTLQSTQVCKRVNSWRQIIRGYHDFKIEHEKISSRQPVGAPITAAFPLPIQQ